MKRKFIQLVNSSTNIIKRNNHLSTFNTMTYEVGNPGPGLGQAQNVIGLNRLMCIFFSVI